jgi:hypothetical protein
MFGRVCTTTRTSAKPIRWWLQAGLMRFALIRRILRTPCRKNKAGHGYDPQQFKTMRAIFYASGPNVRPNTAVPPFENVNLYSLIAKILGLDTTPTNGDVKVLAPILRKSSERQRSWKSR